MDNLSTVVESYQENSPWLRYYRRKQDGVYASYTFGPVGRQIKVQSKCFQLLL